MINMKRVLSLALALILSISLAAPAVAAETAAAIELTKTTGTVTVSKSNGKAVSMRTGMRLYNGYNITTAAKSYAWISLDSTKLMKLDASTSVEVRKNGSKLEVNVKYGSASFNVTQTLNSNESLNVSSSTMSVGIRGTFGWVRVTDQWVTEACLLEGSAQCVVADPVTSQLKSALLVGGDTAQCVVYPQDREGDKCDILMKRQTTEGIPGFVLTELVRDVELCDKILDDSGLDVLRDLAQTAGGDPSGRVPDGKSATPEVLGQTERRLSREEAEAGKKQEEIQKEADQQDSNISKDPVWEQPSQPTWSYEPSTPSIPDTPDTPTTYTVTFDSQGGTEVTSATVARGGKVTAPGAPAKDGYAFGGWYKEAACTTAWDFDNDTVPANDITIFAKWIKLYTITFSANGGTVSTTTANVNADGTLAGLPTPTRASNAYTSGTTTVTFDYTFDGWYDINSKKTTTATVFDRDTTVYARWNAEAVVSGSGAMANYVWDDNGMTIGPGFVRPWISLNSLVSKLTVQPGVTSIGSYAFHTTSLESVTIPASVTSIGNGAFYLCRRLTDIYYGGTKVQWVTVAKGTDAIPTGVTVHCIDDQYTVTFDANGGPSTLTAPDPVKTDTAGKAALPTIDYTPNTDGTLAFAGWFTEPSGGTQVTSDTVFTADQTVYAHWTGWDWELTDGTLRIYGTGAMSDFYSAVSQPWKDSRTAITDVSIENGITSVGGYAFEDCTSLESVTIPVSVRQIHLAAFHSTNLKDIYFGGTRTQWNAVTKGTNAIPGGVTVTCSDGTVTAS